MKKNKAKIQPEDALKFLEDMRTLNSKKDLPKKLISIRIPENLINLLKTKAELEDRKYQNLIVESIREYLTKET